MWNLEAVTANDWPTFLSPFALNFHHLKNHWFLHFALIEVFVVGYQPRFCGKDWKLVNTLRILNTTQNWLNVSSVRPWWGLVSRELLGEVRIQKEEDRKSEHRIVVTFVVVLQSFSTKTFCTWNWLHRLFAHFCSSCKNSFSGKLPEMKVASALVKEKNNSNKLPVLQLRKVSFFNLKFSLNKKKFCSKECCSSFLSLSLIDYFVFSFFIFLC